MRRTARVFLIDFKLKRVLLFNRDKFGFRFYAVPGGTIEKGETIEEAAVREVKEETSLDVVLGRLLWVYEDKFSKGFYFLAESFSGEPKLGGEELERHERTGNKYFLEWVHFDEIPKINLLPKEIKARLCDFLKV